MWKKDESAPNPPETATIPRTAAPKRESGGRERATIGRSITIKGEVSGDEDLLIQGQVDGAVDLELHAVTVGSEGRVKANITGRVVTVEGEVEGDLKAQEQVILRSSASVKGDITAPRVVLEDGASFRGLVDMGVPASSEKASTSSTSKPKGANGAAESSAKSADADGGSGTSKDAGSSSGSSKTLSGSGKSGVGAVEGASP